MATDLELNDAWDLDLVDGDLVLIRDRAEVLQSVKIRLLFIATEWAFDFTIGVPWANGMFDIRWPKIKKESYLKKAITETLGVRALINFEFNIDREEHGAFVAFTAETIYGPVTAEVSV
jgi:hypothetical protein